MHENTVAEIRQRHLSDAGVEVQQYGGDIELRELFEIARVDTLGSENSALSRDDDRSIHTLRSSGSTSLLLEPRSREPARMNSLYCGEGRRTNVEFVLEPGDVLLEERHASNAAKSMPVDLPLILVVAIPLSTLTRK
ncbi:hypothetical protein [Amycolatopsis decaplanina]|nr:hypothetical protein [Amycolatopsis decaplanina]